jgi:hypothetical protein
VECSIALHWVWDQVGRRVCVYLELDHALLRQSGGLQEVFRNRDCHQRMLVIDEM